MDADAPEAIQGGEAVDGEGFHSMSEEDIKRLLEKMKSPKLLQDLEEEPVGEGLPITNIDGLTPVEALDGLWEAGADKERPPAVSSSKSAGSKGPFYYDEWDYQQRAYRRKWCTLREKTVPENDLGLFDKIYDNYSNLILKVKKQFQRIRPEVLEIVRRMEWGPEIDFNAMIQSVVDRKAGDSPSDRIFTRMEKKVRRISTLLLVDMSASTDRLVSLVDPTGETSQGSSGITLEGRGPLTDTQEKKIIDVEIEGLVVITEALQSLGDDYAIFGFSGYGREQVDFYSIKDFDENYSETIKSRICGIQPQKGTRMGPAIRHAIEKLNQVVSDQRLLVLLSDGFPQDFNYGEDRSSKEYALYDTMMALAEAKMFGIRPFCITVDLAGDDYLRKMCNPDSYLIVKDVYSLPEVLPKVIESLVL
jgi:nitric oxide reductase activation protein